MAKQSRKPKTNAVRILERENVTYELMEYDINDGLVDGVSVAEKTGQSVDVVFKTLVTKASAKELFVFLVPVALELDLKKAAKAAGIKKIEMLPLSELTKETGYVRGGCSAVGMKKNYPTFIHNSARLHTEIIISAGLPGLQMRLPPESLAKITNANFYDIVKE
ncbi:Cys-tRNA(Pro) deacylase [Sporosarcina sp. FA9]|uniref:Cys-tRNA(Pro) deacylase n=1 Tax=Sporosarcina sp. FA9 TaxID=3413030 RepID=UPI003F6562F3